MCLYPRMVENPKYKANKKNKGVIPECRDERHKYIAIGCGECIECRQKRVREWWIRIEWECKTNKTAGKYITLSFSDESLRQWKNDSNYVCAKAIELFSQRWYKKFKKAPRYWLSNEIGGNNTERVHMHGFIWEDVDKETLTQIWKYGNVDISAISEDKIIYCTKYILKPDKKHEGFKSKIFASKGIGKGFMDTEIAERYKREGVNARQYMRTNNGAKIDIPIYYRNKLFTEETREDIWSKLLDKETRYVRGLKIDVSTKEGQKIYEKRLRAQQEVNESLGYPKYPWDIKRYRAAIKKLEKDTCENLEM